MTKKIGGDLGTRSNGLIGNQSLPYIYSAELKILKKLLVMLY